MKINFLMMKPEPAQLKRFIIWQKAMDLAEEVNSIAQKFPKEELYNLCSQIRRASDSIALNISEGAIA